MGFATTVEEYERAKKIHASEWKGWVYWDGAEEDEEFFPSIEKLRSYCKARNVPAPVYVWACYDRGVSIDVDDVIEIILDEHHENARDEIPNAERDRLQTILDEWCAAQKVKTYYRDTDVVILLDDQSPPGRSPSTT